MAEIGYARVSTAEQDPALQLDALAKVGCTQVFQDKASGATDRPGLTAALAFVREGDVLVVWKLDRLGRSLPHLIETVSALETRGVGFRSLTEAIDTTTPGGRLIFHIFGALGQFENQRYRASGLNLAVAAIILWNTTYLSRAAAELRSAGTDLPDELLAHIAPLGWEHINFNGDYIWPTEPIKDGFRPLRNPNASILDAA